MKKSLLLRLAIFGFVGLSVLPSCKKTQSENTTDNTVEESKIDPKEEVTTFVNEFVKNLGSNLRDSVAYPEILLADSIAPVSADSISISEAAPGQFDVQLSDGITMKVNRSENGKISVAESHGLFVFPKDKVEIAKKTGMWDATLSDAQLNERLKDEEFFKWVKNAKTIKSSDIIALGRTEGDGFNTRGFRHVVNKTDQKIKGSDYYVIRKYEYAVFNGWDVDESRGTEVLPGKDIPPHGSVKYEFSNSSHGGEEISGVKLKLTPAQIQEKFSAFNGNEYQQYLSTKK